MPQHPPYRVVVIGAGFAGIGMAAALRQAGIEDFVVIDRGHDIGGTWRDNTYPGLCCDVPASLYSFSFRPGRWTRRFPRREEILAYLRAVATERDLIRHLRLNTAVTAAAFDEFTALWTLTLGNGDSVQACAVVSAVGQLTRPAFPDIAGSDDFTGQMWHSARWNHNVSLAWKRVAVIGTGASAVQLVPEIAQSAAHVDVYQRSAPYVLPKKDRPYRSYEQSLLGGLPLARKASRLRTFLAGELLTSGLVVSPKLLAAPMLAWRRQLRVITDPELRARCTPGYVMGCKRVLFSSDWYPALTRPDVDLVTDPIERIAPMGVVTAGGTLHLADVIVYGTGYRAGEFLAPMSVSGLRGQTLSQAWRDGAEAYLGITVPRFPNFFLLYGPNTNLGGNSVIYMLEGQIRYVRQALLALRNEHLAWLDVRPEVHAAFGDWVARASRSTVWHSGCSNWYTSATGRNVSNWPAPTFRYRHRVRRFELSDYNLLPERTAAPALGMRA